MNSPNALRSIRWPLVLFWGIVLAAFIGLVQYISGEIYYVRIGNSQIPRFAFGLVLLAALGLNPLLYGLFGDRARLRPAELALVLGIMLAATHASGRQLLYTLTTVTLPAQRLRANPGWQKNEVFDYAPRELLVGGGEYHEEVLETFYSGVVTEGPLQGGLEHTISGSIRGFQAIPWEYYITPGFIWLVLFGLTTTAILSLGLVVHRQWSRRERLRYPIAQFANSLLDQEPGHILPSIARSRLFWLGLALIVGLRGVNILGAWFPQMVTIPLRFPLTPILQKYPTLARLPTANQLCTLTFVPAIVAFSYFLAADVSFSLGISQALFVFTMYVLIKQGVSNLWGTTGFTPAQMFGAYLGLGVMMLYVGRRYYWHVLRAALAARPSDEVEAYATWSARIFIVAITGLVGVLMLLGLEWTIAIFCVAMLILFFIVFARITAESGLFFFSSTWGPMTVVLGLFGSLAIGPEAAAIVGLVSYGLALSYPDFLMPMVVNGLKIADDAGASPPKTAGGMGLGYTIGLAAGIVGLLAVIYGFGIIQNDWTTRRVPEYNFNVVKTTVDDLTLTDQLEESLSLGPLARLTHMRPEPTFVWSMLFGMGMVMFLTFMRLRYTWWPLHPIAFLVLGAWAVRPYWASYMLGCGIKLAVSKFGGSQTYRKVMALMVGILAGEITLGALYILFSWLYCWITGEAPRGYPGAL